MKTVEEIYGYKSNPEVLKFIDDFVGRAGENTIPQDLFRDVFRNGYCWHFAHMLKSTFHRGEVCWVAPYSHMAWVDDNGCPYDIEGVCSTEALYFIPEYYLDDNELYGYKHIDDDNPSEDFTEDHQIWNVIRAYETENELPPADQYTWFLADKPAPVSMTMASDFDG